MAITKQKTESKRVKVLPQDKGYAIILEKENITRILFNKR